MFDVSSHPDPRPISATRISSRLFSIFLLPLIGGGVVRGEEPPSVLPLPLTSKDSAEKPATALDVDERFRLLESRLNELEHVNENLRDENRRLAEQVGRPQSQEAVESVRDADPDGWAPEEFNPTYVAPAPWHPRFDEGFVLLEPDAIAGQPFQLKVNVVSQFRYTNLSPGRKTWTDAAGTTRPIAERSDFEIQRNYLALKGFAFDPRLQFNATLLGSSAANKVAWFGWINYEFSKRFNLFGGFWKLPGSREWYESYTATQGVDRTMATTFFRPNMTGGVWATGELFKDFHYVAKIGNALNSSPLNASRKGFGMAYSGTVWWEPLGSFGPGFSDLEYHDKLAVRIGTSQTTARDDRQLDPAQAFPENTQTRLSDGTPVFETGALAPGVTLLRQTSMTSAFDLGFKWRGLSLTGEYYLRWLGDFQANGRIPFDTLYDNGGYIQAAGFLVPRKYELFVRSSYVSGRFGTGHEVGGGLNWFVYQNRNVRGTFEVLQILHSPADNILTGYRAGETGTLIQAQVITIF
ncbi:hypothetical protein VT85_12895 [Planctomyces sp. SH-PL62]|nr:hypothetical protein VT85_12895 [Planctomyces sp. SH-PL62]